MDMIKTLAAELQQNEQYVANVVKLLDEGNTVPFIARYRKEMHGTMDDQTIRVLAERLAYLRGLETRKAEIRDAIDAQGKLTPELTAAIENAATLSALDDIYRPYRPKRRTRASMAREKGLEPLADAILSARNASPSLEALAQPYISEEKGVSGTDAALAGASDIIAENLSDDATLRGRLRDIIQKTGVIRSASDNADDTTYTMYHDFSEPVRRMQSHRVLALDRGEKEGVLKVTLECDEQAALSAITRAVLHPRNPFGAFLRDTAADSWKRLLFPSLERETRNELTDKACEQAIRIFALNLRPLLMQPPVRGRVTLGFDPGYRNGCKLAVVDATGKVLDTAVIYPHKPQCRVEDAKKTLRRLCTRHHVTCIAIGNGTASKESELLVAEFIRENGGGIAYMVVSEAGASVYSASKLAAEEFPDYDVNLRSAVSIARRLQDPLAELVKIDPKAIGVGQYQHDMNQKKLGEALGGVVEDCVNKVGVDLNTASASLLEYISGVSKVIAKNIVAYREENGRFESRKELLKVAKLGPKAFEQCAGFMRITGGKNPLDGTSVHPESYEAVEKLFAKLNMKTEQISEGSTAFFIKDYKKMAEEIGVGEITLRDIIKELQKPGRDPRDEMPRPILRTDVLDMKDLKVGMILKGTVRNVIDFGAFVDIGVHQDGLVHISQMTKRFIKHPLEAVSVGDIVEVKVISLDLAKKRIGLSMLLDK